MTKFGKLLLAVILVAILALIIFFLQKKPLVDESPTNGVTSEILGNKDDLVHFSILPGQKVSGMVSYAGSVKNAYFFEANILINVLDANKNLLKGGYAMATTDWMTVEPVVFSGSIDFTGLPKGPAYIEIHNDNPSGLPENDKNILIPVIIN